jgi:glycosyltransferase involved in cell wall biosynthesis
VSDQAEASVVIAARDAAGRIGAQLDALAAQTFAGRMEVVVVDNRSTDGTAAVASRHRTPAVLLRVVDAPRRANAAYARNLGVGHTTAPVVLFCDADDVVDRGWVAALVARLEAGCDVVGGRLDRLPLNDERVLRWRPAGGVEEGLPVAYGYLPFAPSSNLGIRRDRFQALSGFDEDLPRAEDVDLCWRLQRDGGRLCYEPGARVAYRHRPTVLGTLQQAYRWGYAGELVLRKHAGAPGLQRRPLGSRFAALARAAPRHLLGPGRQVDWLRKVSHDAGMLAARLRRSSE